MPDALTIRPATPNDAQAIARIRVQGWRFAYQGLISQDYLDSLSVAEDTERMRGYLSQLPQNSPPSRSASVQGSSDGKKRSFMLAARGDAVLGFCRFSAAPDKTDRAESAVPAGTLNGRLHSLYIDPDTLGQGIGHALMRSALLPHGDVSARLSGFWREIPAPSASTNGKAGGTQVPQRWTSPLDRVWLSTKWRCSFKRHIRLNPTYVALAAAIDVSP